MYVINHKMCLCIFQLNSLMIKNDYFFSRFISDLQYKCYAIILSIIIYVSNIFFNQNTYVYKG